MEQFEQVTPGIRLGAGEGHNGVYSRVPHAALQQNWHEVISPFLQPGWLFNPEC